MTGLILACCLLVTACSTGGPGSMLDSLPDAGPAATAEFVAETAYLHDKHFYIHYRTGKQSGYLTGVINQAEAVSPLFRDKQPIAVPTEVALQILVPADWQAHPAAAQQALHILPAAHWAQAFRLLRELLTPQQPNMGAVIDILELEEWFTYYDTDGTLQWVLLEDKPAGVKVKYSYSFAQVLELLATVLTEHLEVSDIDSRQVLLNTGTADPDSTPLVYADLDTKQVLFLTRRPPATSTTGGPADAAPLRATTHVMFGQVRSLLQRPMSSIGQLFARTSQDVADTLHRTVLLPAQTGELPPLEQGPGMDLEAWELRLDELTGAPTSSGRMHFLVDGVEFFPRLIDVIQSARDSIDIRMYIFDDDDFALKVADILKARSQEVKIKILLDGLGTIGSAMEDAESLPAEHRPPASIFDYLRRDSAIKVKSVSNFLLTGDHSKSVVIDKQIGFIGGMNIGREYRYDWHDMMIELEGPVIDILRKDFYDAWIKERFFGDLQLMMHRYKPVARETEAGDYPIRVLFTRPMDSQIYRAQLAAIRRAQSYIYIENAYFTDDVILDELLKARARGVDVRVILPVRSDFGVMTRNNTLVANTLLENGIRVFIYPGMSHLKAAVYDGWICLGSANLDKLSLRINREINVATSHPPAVNDLLERVFVTDMAAAVELKEPFPENWLDFLIEMMADHL